MQSIIHEVNQEFPGSLIHYGANKFNPKKFKKIQNDSWIKPIGGLWLSPEDTEYGWRDFCTSEGFRTEKLQYHFRAKFKGNAKILVIDSLSDLSILPMQNAICGLTQVPDFEKIAKKYHAIWLTERGQIQTRFGHPHNLYGWDCECVIILNSECFYEI